MITRPRAVALSLALLAIVAVAGSWQSVSFNIAFHRSSPALPSRFSDQEYWEMVGTFSEPGGTFRSNGAVRADNLVSNESSFQQVIPALQGVAQSGAYLGVGPEQNRTYIAALKPAVAFIVDIRRGNMLVHLLYK